MSVCEMTWAEVLGEGVELVRAGKRGQERVDDWFYVQEQKMLAAEELKREGLAIATPEGQAELLCRVAERMPISLLPGSVLAGSQDCAFSPSYALINPAFKVESFAGYCDPTAIYADLAPDPAGGLTAERIAKVRDYWKNEAYAQGLASIAGRFAVETSEVVFFMEPVTGHLIPDLRPALRDGLGELRRQALASGTAQGRAMARSLEAPLILARRYRELATKLAARTESGNERRRLTELADRLARVPEAGAANLAEAVQVFALLWQAMVLEQAPNPYAFSAGNLDRILEPYYSAEREGAEAAVELVRHLLTFFQVGRRCWAISQNVLVGGSDASGRDLTSAMTYAVLDAFYASNDPQPALSAKVHRGTPAAVYESLGRFFFTPGHSTPSLFNDESVFELLAGQGVERADLADYAIAGCQEPLVMGKSSVNTTNTWLNLGKILELAANEGRSLLTGKKLGLSWAEMGYAGEAEAYADLRGAFFRQLDYFLPRLAEAGNASVTLLGQTRPVPFTSTLMGGFSSGRDLREPAKPGARYNGSGCLVHGLSCVANGLHAVERVLAVQGATAGELRSALQGDFAGSAGGQVRALLLAQEKYGNGLAAVDGVAAELVDAVSTRLAGLRNPAGQPFLADWSTPSTHLLYGYWVGATPDGRRARTMLGYGIDPLPGTAKQGLAARIASAWRLPFARMTGGYASHLGISPRQAQGADAARKGLWLRDQVIAPLFRLTGQAGGKDLAPYYVYFNLADGTQLREVLKQPARYAPDGIYIVRIHGTFVNFLDLSPSIQEDIIARLDPESTAA